MSVRRASRAYGHSPVGRPSGRSPALSYAVLARKARRLANGRGNRANKLRLRLCGGRLLMQPPEQFQSESALVPDRRAAAPTSENPVFLPFWQVLGDERRSQRGRACGPLPAYHLMGLPLEWNLPHPAGTQNPIQAADPPGIAPGLRRIDPVQAGASFPARFRIRCNRSPCPRLLPPPVALNPERPCPLLFP